MTTLKKSLVLVALLIAVAIVFTVKTGLTPKDEFVVRDIGIAELEYSDLLLTVKPDLKNGQFFIAQEPDSEKPLLLEVQLDGNYRAATGVTGETVLGVFKKNYKQSLSVEYPEFKEVKSEVVTVDGIESFSVIYTYVNADSTIKRRIIAVPRNDDEVILLSFQSLAEDYQSLEDKYFKEFVDKIDIK